MVLSKQWLNDEMEKYREKKKHPSGEINEIRESDINDGIIWGLQLAFDELIKAPVKSTHAASISKKQESHIDHDKAYASIVKFYIEKKGYSVQRANEIAITIVKEQQQQRITKST